MAETERKFTLERIEKTLKYKNTPTLSLKINYPVFYAENKRGKEAEFINKINKFYKTGAERFLSHAASRYSSRDFAYKAKNEKAKPRISMTSNVSYTDKNFVSIFVDFSSSDGENAKNIRLSQLWSAEKSAILPPKYVFDTGRRAKRYIKELIYKTALHNAQNPSFCYRKNFKSVIFRKFSFENFYFVPRGVAFFYDKGMLLTDNSAAVFVIPHEKLDGVLKITKKTEYN
ncbi:MAG: hypothetical protein J5844_04485 [Clostridia bacterium]|nr:hypothetical protein [Clostridia bacterium]